MITNELKIVLDLARTGLQTENEKLDEEGRKLENIMKHHINDTLQKWLRDGHRRSQELKDSERILKDFSKEIRSKNGLTNDR